MPSLTNNPSSRTGETLQGLQHETRASVGRYVCVPLSLPLRRSEIGEENRNVHPPYMILYSGCLPRCHRATWMAVTLCCTVGVVLTQVIEAVLWASCEAVRWARLKGPGIRHRLAPAPHGDGPLCWAVYAPKEEICQE